MGNFPERLRLLRKANSLSLGDLADELGISKQFLWDLERGRRRVHGELLLKIAVYFDVSADFLLGLVDEPNKVITRELKTVESKFDPDTIRILHRASDLSIRGQEQFRRLVEWICDVDERDRTM